MISYANSLEKAKAIKAMHRVACGTACIIHDAEGRMLMLKRKGAHGEGTWSVPGGWVEAGEHPEDTIKREVWEEVGLTIDTVVFVGYTFDQHIEDIEDVCLWFRAVSWKGTGRATHPDKVEAVDWFQWDDLPGPLFHPFNNAVRAGLLPT